MNPEKILWACFRVVAACCVLPVVFAVSAVVYTLAAYGFNRPADRWSAWLGIDEKTPPG